MHKGLAARVCITACLSRKKNCNQPKHLTIGDWLKHVSSIYTIELCIATKNDANYLEIRKYVHSGVSNKINMSDLTNVL